MIMKFILLLLASLLYLNASVAIGNDTLRTKEDAYIYTRPHKFHFLTAIPGDIADYAKNTFQKKNTLNIAMMLAGTAVLVVFDQNMTDGFQVLGNHLGIAPTNDQKTFLDLSFHIGKTKIPIPLNGPYDLNSSLYYLGDGITHFSIAGGFYAYGLFKQNNRAIQTASQLCESILTSGLVVQLLKHLSGRESPFTATAPGGIWRVFPNQFTYSSHVPHYDAFPSGHIATAMATVTVLAANYPDCKLIRPIGYTCMGLLTFAMLNNGVHWASDYPLGIAIGYAFAKIAINKGRQKLESAPSHSQFNLKRLKPDLLMPSVNGLGARWVF
jgi:hypothetical protein